MTTATSCRLAPVLAGGVDSVGSHWMAWSMRLARWISMCLIAGPQAAAFGQVGDAPCSTMS
jgi:hypothetical protein